MATPVLSPAVLTAIENELVLIKDSVHDEVTSDIWYQKVVKRVNQAPTKKITTLIPISDARIKPMGSEGGQNKFDELSISTTEETFSFAGTNFEIAQHDLAALQSGGLEAAADWVATVTREGLLYPQQILASGLINNTLQGVDSQVGGPVIPLFGQHQNHYKDASRGVFSNLLTGAASGEFPGACPVLGVSIDVAIANLAKVRAYIQTRRTPNGLTMINAKIDKVIVAPSAAAQFSQIMGAKQIAQAASGGAGSANVEAVISWIGVGELVIAPELEIDSTTYYVTTRAAATDPIGAIKHAVIQDFDIQWLSPMTDAELMKAGDLTWKTQSWFGLRGGHPRGIYKVKAT